MSRTTDRFYFDLISLVTPTDRGTLSVYRFVPLRQANPDIKDSPALDFIRSVQLKLCRA